jgi:hypothetical protein
MSGFTFVPILIYHCFFSFSFFGRLSLFLHICNTVLLYFFAPTSFGDLLFASLYFLIFEASSESVAYRTCVNADSFTLLH